MYFSAIYKLHCYCWPFLRYGSILRYTGRKGRADEPYTRKYLSNGK